MRITPTATPDANNLQNSAATTNKKTHDNTTPGRAKCISDTKKLLDN